VDKKAVRSEKNALSSNSHRGTYGCLLRGFEVVRWLCFGKCASAVAVALALGIAFDIAAMPWPGLRGPRRIWAPHWDPYPTFPSLETFLPRFRVVSEYRWSKCRFSARLFSPGELKSWVSHSDPPGPHRRNPKRI